MYRTRDDIDAILGVEAESGSLEFKAGPALVGLGADRLKRCEFIKDITAFSNAGGGTILYGVGEKQAGGLSIATSIVPVPTGEVTRDRLTQMIHANTDPPLRGCAIWPIDVGEGQVVVVEVDEGDTATQNRIDFLFYQRVEATTSRMSGYAVRDVMNRRRVPKLWASIATRDVGSGAVRHNYAFDASLRNVGSVTAAHWRLLLDIPAGVHVHLSSDLHHVLIRRPGVSVDDQTYDRYEYSSERSPPATSMLLLPGEGIDFHFRNGFPEITLEVTAAVVAQTLTKRPPLRWTLHVDNAAPESGLLPYPEWCKWPT